MFRYLVSKGGRRPACFEVPGDVSKFVGTWTVKSQSQGTALASTLGTKLRVTLMHNKIWKWLVLPWQATPPGAWSLGNPQERGGDVASRVRVGTVPDTEAASGRGPRLAGCSLQLPPPSHLAKVLLISDLDP